MKIVIFGTGGVGGYFGGRLANNGEDVTFIARGEHLAALRDSGLYVESINGDFIVHPVKATDSPSSIGIADLIVLAVKAWQLTEVIPQLRAMMAEHTMILPLLNGMEHMDTLLDMFGSKHVLGGLCRISAVIAAPGRIGHVGIQPYIAYGEWDNSESERIQTLHHIFSSVSGITAEIPNDIQTAMWEKFIFISGTSGVGSFTRLTTGEYRSDPQARAMLINAMNETSAVARARGVAIAENFVEATMQRIDNLPAQMTASMQKDVMAGRPSELNEQTGAVIRMGKALGVPTPTQEKIFAALLPLEQKARSR
ncbi:MAG: 2-dehydropantoate 2-reductase [Anaerolineales bacterium]|nr:2-dehydropantoate 2-reductase [Anaerolineales bacterium]